MRCDARRGTDNVNLGRLSSESCAHPKSHVDGKSLESDAHWHGFDGAVGGAWAESGVPEKPKRPSGLGEGRDR
jgi:hypothetical protein